MTALESEEMTERVAAFAAEEAVDSVLLEPSFGRCWLYDKDGQLLKKGEPTFEVEPEIKGRYAICSLRKDDDIGGLWDCTISDGDELIKEVAAEF